MEMLNSIGGRLSRDAKSGGLRLTLAPRGRHSAPVNPTAKPEEATTDNPTVSAQFGAVREAGGYYWRKGYEYRRVPHVQRYRSGRRKAKQWKVAADGSLTNEAVKVQVPGHWVKMPPIDIGDGATMRTSKSGWWWYLYYREMARDSKGKVGKTVRHKGDRNPVIVGLLNKDIANYLSKRLGRGKWATGWTARPNPFIQPAPKDMQQLRKLLEQHVLSLKARGLFQHGGAEFDRAT